MPYVDKVVDWIRTAFHGSFNRNLVGVSIGEFEEEWNRKARISFHVVNTDNIAIAAIWATPCDWSLCVHLRGDVLVLTLPRQGYLVHTNPPHPRTLQ